MTSGQSNTKTGCGQSLGMITTAYESSPSSSNQLNTKAVPGTDHLANNLVLKRGLVNGIWHKRPDVL